MKRITIRELRLHWPATEAALELEGEILVTRDSRPVAKLVRITPPSTRRPRWTPAVHRRWIQKTFGDQVFPSIDKPLQLAREERQFR